MHGEEVVVRVRPLLWRNRRLELGEPQLETVTQAMDGLRLVRDLQPGEWVALHWSWVCDRLTRRQLTDLQRISRRQLDITNDEVGRPGAAMVLG